MKWFQHYSNSHSNLKLRAVIKEYGMEGYGLFWLCDELVADQGHNLSIKANEDWMDALEFISHLKKEKIAEMVQFFANLNLISKKSLLKGILSIPKLGKYSDDYSKRSVRIPAVQKSKKVPKDNNRIDNTTLDKNREELEFFTSQEFLESELCGTTAEKLGAAPDWVATEGRKFGNYWTEPDQRGTPLWRKKKTFEVKRRWVTWIERAVEYAGQKTQGRQVIKTF